MLETAVALVLGHLVADFLLPRPALRPFVEQVDDDAVKRGHAFALDRQPAGPGHVVEPAPRGLEGGAARVGEARRAEALDRADADGGAGGEAEVGGAKAGGEHEHGAQREAGLGDDLLPAVAAVAGEARVRGGGRPAGQLARGLGEEVDRALQDCRLDLGGADQVAGQDRRRSPVRVGHLQASKLDLVGSSFIA